MKKLRLVMVAVLAMMFISGSAFAYSGGSGTESDPYLIADKADLLELAANTDDYDKCFKMTADIDLAGTNFSDGVIGQRDTQFTGIFDGNAKTVQNLFIDGEMCIGLFGSIGQSGEVKNLNIVDCNIRASIGVGGGLCGLNEGKITYCSSAGTVYATQYAGGLSGFNDGVITFSYSTCMISGSSMSGGFCGGNFGSISSSYSTGDVDCPMYVGGFSGVNDGAVSSCYSIGSVSGSDFVGGFCSTNVSGSISSCFWDIETSGQLVSNGAVGKTTAEMQTESTFTDAGWDVENIWFMNGYPILRWQVYLLEVNNGSGTGLYLPGETVPLESMSTEFFDFVEWSVEPSRYTNNIADVLSSTTTFSMPDEDVVITAIFKYYSGGSGTEDDPYLIATKNDLLALGATTNDYDKSFKMTADIDMSNTVFTNAVIGLESDYSHGMHYVAFTGLFDGGSNDILNLVIEGDSFDYVGLFGLIGAGEVKNLGIVDCNISGNNYVGGLCGKNEGTITASYSTGTIDGNDDVGGLCGYNGGTFTSCYSTVSVSGNDDVGGFCGCNNDSLIFCFSAGAVSGNSGIGGFCGKNTEQISYCYSTGSINGDSDVGGLCGYNDWGTIQFCYSTGSVVGNSYSGGLCGFTSNDQITSCFWDEDTSGLLTSNGGTGKTTLEMKTQSTFTDAGWDFTYAWIMRGYPVFRWQVHYLQVNNGSGSGYYLPGEEITVESISSYFFDLGEWIADPAEYIDNFADVSSSVTTFTMPDESVTITSILKYYGGGAGTQSDPYLIGNVDEFLAMARNTNDYDKCFKMIADINLSDTNFTTAVIAADINNIDNTFNGTSFSGIFDGNCNDILNLSVDGGGTNDFLGLFGSVAEGAEIKNLGIADCNIEGRSYIGSICGVNKGIIQYCYSTGSVSGNEYAGGFCGQNGYNINNCYSTTSVSGNNYVGGFCGCNNSGYIDICYSAGAVLGNSVAGGFCSTNISGVVSRCFWDTETSGLSVSDGGSGKSATEMQTESTFADAGWNFEDIWYMYGYPMLEWQIHVLTVNNGSGDGVYTEGTNINISADIFGNAYTFHGWSADPEEYTDNIGDRSALNTEFLMPDADVELTAVWLCTYSGGSGTEDDPFLISNRDDLLAFTFSTNDYNKNFRMISNIDLSGTDFSKAIIAPSRPGYWETDNFSGTFDGDHHVVSGLSIISDDDFLGLFGVVGKSGRICNLGVTGNVTGTDYYIGGLVGRNMGIISNCFSDASVIGVLEAGGLCGENAYGIIVDCYFKGNVKSCQGGGGICGANIYGEISRCYSSGSIVGYSDATVTENNTHGGICGLNYSAGISNCYSTCSVAGSSRVGGVCGFNRGSIDSSYSAGTVTGDSYVGGVCGNSDDSGSAASSFWDMELSGITTSAGGTGKTTAEMQTQSTFTDAGWDFENTWIMDGYPVLRFFYVSVTTYQQWLDSFGVPADEQEYTDCPGDDEIQNLLKYAIGLNPMEACSTADVMQPVVDSTNTYSIIYNKAKDTADVDLYPTWTDCLIPADWSADGFEFEQLSETPSNVTWKATHSATGECGYIRLEAQMD